MNPEFLDINGITIDYDSENLYDLTMRVAKGKTDKKAISSQIEKLATKYTT